FFFFQAEDGIRDRNVTGVQTCALPIFIVSTIVLNRSGYNKDGTPTNELGNGWGYYDCGMHNMNLILKPTELGLSTLVMGIRDEKIGRASCRERVCIVVGGIT